MQRSILSLIVSALFLMAILTTSAYAGDCTKTLMGGGCGAEQDDGLAPHMRSHAQTAASPQTLAKDTKTQKNIKVSDKPAQKPKI